MATTSQLASRPRGRPQRLPVDATDWTSPDFDSARRVAWLLAVTRLLSPVSLAGGRAAFIESMAQHGQRLDTSRVSRLEAGDHLPPAAVIAGYELVTGAPEGSLQSVSSCLRRMGGAPRQTERHPLLSTGDLDTIFDRIERRRATGSDWLRLSWELEDRDRVYLPPSTWGTLTQQLMAELTCSSGLAYVRRHHAAAIMLRQPSGHRHLTLGIGRFVMHPDVQSVAPALSLLKEVPDDSALDLVVRLMNGSSPLLRRGAAGVVGALAARDGFLHEDRSQALERYLVSELRRPNLVEQHPDVLDLASRLPAESYERVVATIEDPRTRATVSRACTSVELVERDMSRSVCEAIATYAEAASGRAAQDPDQMLRRLLREAMFHLHRERRELAALVLVASPYARPIAAACLQATHDLDETTAGASWSLLRRLGHVLDRGTVGDVALAERRPSLHASALIALGLSRGSISEAMAHHLCGTAREGSGTRLEHAATFALGMTGHPRLAALAADSGPRQQAARWWTAVGPAIHDL
ncbi:MAG: hypothetical protein WB471_10620 [Nocardioides sp.]